MDDPTDDGDADRVSPNAETTGIDRLVFFSDAVFAIAMTLLVLPLIAGGQRSDGGWAGFEGKSSQLYAFAISFWVIGLYWMGHHRMFRRISAYDETLMRLNLLLLFLIAFLPYPSAISGRFPHDVDATVFYAATLSVIGLVVTLVAWYAFRYRRLGVADDRVWHGMLLRSLIVPAVFLPSIAVAFASVAVARAMWWVAFLAGVVSRRSVARRPTR